MSSKFIKTIFTTMLLSLVFVTSLPAEENSPSEPIEKEQIDETNNADLKNAQNANLVIETTDQEICNLPAEEPTPAPKAEETLISKAKDYVLYPFTHEFEELILLKSNEAIVILNDNSRWIIRNFLEEEQTLYQQDPWQKTDEIRISKRTAFDRQGNFSIKNMRTNKSYPVHFDTTSLKNAKTHMIEKIDSNGYFITTENKTDWEIFWTSSWTSCLWRPLDSLLISKGDCSGKNTYLLINLSTQESVNAEIIQWK